MALFPLTIQNSVTSLDLLNKVGQEFLSGADLKAVLNRVLALLIDHFGLVNSSIVVLNENKQPGETVILTPGFEPENGWFESQLGYVNNWAGWVANNKKPVLINDISQDEQWLKIFNENSAFAGHQSALSTPIVSCLQTVGVMTLVHSHPNFFNKEHQDLVQSIANQAGMAILNTRLRSVQQRQMVMENVWAECAITMSESDCLADLMKFILMQISQVLKTDFVSLYLVDEALGELEFRFANSLAQQKLIGRRFTVGKGITGWVAKTGQGLIVPNIYWDGRFQPEVDWGAACKQHAQAMICGPIRSQGKVAGVIAVTGIGANSFDQLDLLFLDGIGALIGAAIRRAYLDEKPKTLHQPTREDLIEMIYHDLRSPLSNVISSLEALNKFVLGNEIAESLVKIALRSTQHAQRLTHSLFDINRLETCQIFSTRNRVNIAKLMDDCIAAVNYLALDTQIHIIREIKEKLEDIWVDEVMIQRVIINLLENAVKFTPSKGKIWLGVKRMNENMLFWVRDFGPGIFQASQEKIFKKFVRLHPQEKTQGLGLGLAYCYLAVQAHGGQIWVESQSGEGACFKFTIPITFLDQSNADALSASAATLEDRWDEYATNQPQYLL